MTWRDSKRSTLTATQRKRKNSPTMPVGRWIKPVRRLAIYIRDKFECQLCGKDLHDASPREMSLDHWKPRAKGGTNASSNLFLACHSCNSKRADGPLPRGRRMRVAIACGSMAMVHVLIAQGMLEAYPTWAESVAAAGRRFRFRGHIHA